MSLTHTTIQTLKRKLPELCALAGMAYGPLIGIEMALRIGNLGNPQDSEQLAEIIVSLLGLVVLPVLNSAVLHLASADRKQQNLPLFSAIRKGFSSWYSLVVGYIAVSFVVMGWAFVGLLPGLLTLYFVGQDKAYLLIPFLAPAIYMAARYGFMESLIVVAGKDPYTARQESMRLSKGLHLNMFLAGLLLIGLPLSLEHFSSAIGKAFASGSLGIFIGGFIEFIAAVLNMIYLLFFFHWYASLELKKD